MMRSVRFGGNDTIIFIIGNILKSTSLPKVSAKKTIVLFGLNSYIDMFSKSFLVIFSSLQVIQNRSLIIRPLELVLGTGIVEFLFSNTLFS
jgi:hypothetical protein